MGDASFTQDSFLGGVWSPLAQGRVTDQRYRTAMAVCLNGIPLEAGAWTRRPGTKFATFTPGGLQARVIAFDFEESHPYTMVISALNIRFLTGASVVMTNDAQAVAAISTANPAVVQTSAPHGWSTGNTVYFTDLGVNDPLLQNRPITITVTDSTHFSIAGAMTGTAIDGSTLGTFVSGNVKRVMEITTPYKATDLASLRSVQAEKQSVFLHGAYAPNVLSVVTDPSNTQSATFALNTAVFKDGPYLDPVAGGAILTPDGTSGIVNCTVSFNAWSATQTYGIGDFVTYSSNSYKSLVDQNLNYQPDTHSTQWLKVSPSVAVGPNGFLATDIGRMMRMNYEPPLWAVGSTYTTGLSVTYAGAYWTALKSVSAGVIPGTDLTSWEINPNAANWTWGKITGLLNLISGSLSGSANIGTLTGSGGVAASFDGVPNKATSASSTATFSDGSGILGQTYTLSGYVGKDYHSASAQKIGFVTIIPPTDGGIANSSYKDITEVTLTINLRGKQTAPSSASDGTVLGTYTAPQWTGTGATALGASAVTILSNDTATTFPYVWVEAITSTTLLPAGSAGFQFTQTISIAQVEFSRETVIAAAGQRRMHSMQ